MVSNKEKDKLAFIKTASSISSNLAAGWFGLVFVVPNFVPFQGFREASLLTTDLLSGIVFLLASYKLEKTII